MPTLCAVQAIVEARENADTAFMRGVLQSVIVFRWLKVITETEPDLVLSDLNMALMGCGVAIERAATTPLETGRRALETIEHDADRRFLERRLDEVSR